MAEAKNDLIYETILKGFYAASILLRQRPQIRGLENLNPLPKQVVFTITHDSYFEIPALYSVYKAIDPRPVFTIMAKEEFLDGRYLSSNFFKDKALPRSLFKLIDLTGAPKMVFEKMNLISIPRPFADTHDPKYQDVKRQISQQLSLFKDRISDGFSTLIFPEGTTWGYGGLRKIRSAVYQLVSTSFEVCGREVHILPINVKVDRLVRGCRDIFINIGKPQFLLKSREEFNQQLFQKLQNLHIITFSQIVAFYFNKLSQKKEEQNGEDYLTRVQLTEVLKQAIEHLQDIVKEGVLPGIDQNLNDNDYLADKIARFLDYCVKNDYLGRVPGKRYRINSKKVLSTCSHKLYRKRNPLGFHANELASLGREVIAPAFD